MTTKYLDLSGLSYFWGKLKDYFQPKLVSGTNIKTINNNSLLGSGDITISGSGAVTGVKGDAESTYRTGDVNITPANLGIGDERHSFGSSSMTDLDSGVNTYKQLGYVTLDVGIWVVTCQARHTPTSSGARSSTINLNTTSAQNAAEDRRYNTGTGATQHSFSKVIEVSTNNQKWYLNGSASVAGKWNRGSEAAFRIYAVRIK